MISRPQIIAAINTAFDAVNQSKAGPIYADSETGETCIQNLGYNTFLYVVGRMIPQEMDAKMSGEYTERKISETETRYEAE